MRKFYLSLFVLLLASSFAYAQQGSGSIKGKVKDAANGEGVPFCNIIVYLNGNQINGSTTDFDGNYSIKPIDAGTYDVEFSFVGYTPQRVNGFIVNSNKITFLDATLKESDGIDLEEAEVIAYAVPLIDKDGGASGGTVTRDDLAKMPGRSAASIATTVAGVSGAGTDGLSIKGSRSDGTWYYIDGIKVKGTANIPKAAIQEVSVITGGVPANYGDATGGIISVTTRGASAYYFGGIDYLTSGFKSGNTAVGLDKYGYNLIEGFLSGPIAWKKDENGVKDRPVLGFFLSGNYNNTVDPRPAYGGVPYLKDEVRDELLNNPLTPNFSNGVAQGALFNANNIRTEDIEYLDTRQNVGLTTASLAGKIDITTSPTMNITVGGSGSYFGRNNFSYDNMLMNTENNSYQTNLDWRAYGRFSQRFKNDQENTGAVKNIYYSVMLDYSQSKGELYDEQHHDDFFKYGHVGDFDLIQRNAYDLLNNQGTELQHEGFEDVYVTFTPSDFNPSAAAITNQYFQLFPEDQFSDLELQNVLNNPLVNNNPSSYTSFETISAGNGILNGQTTGQTLNLWNYYGTPSNGYSVSSQNQVRFTGAGSADIGDHAIQVGFEYEQRDESSYSLAPVGLWTLARQYANSHITELDSNSVASVENFGSYTITEYNRLKGDNQRAFDRNLREALGLDPNGDDFINVDGLDPELLDLSFFSASDLLEQSGVVSYFGYDHLGNKLKGNKPSLEDFFNDQDSDEEFTRNIGAYQPIYISGYIMDKFSFDDLIFNVGLRIDRFDANQKVLRDPYVIGDARQVKDVADDAFGAHPSNIGDEYTVYVDNVDSPTAIRGYRDGDVWYNAQGTEISDPALLNSSNGSPAPYLVGTSDDELNSNAFEDYTPQINVMPRIAFSFPISDEALFFAHYDVLTQRPTSSNRFNPIDYYYIESRNALINNPNLKPSKTIDYELGFQQVLTKTSSLKIASFYREQRDDIQVRNFTGAYPRQYRAFGNLDFGTVKGLSLTYDMRRTGNIRMNASYTLQFADGTGSDIGTALALINSGLPNLRTVNPTNRDQRHRFVVTLDYRYGGKKDYTGPMVLGKPILADFGVNIVGDLGSGTPYTAQQLATSLTGGGSASTEGSINGSRLPWIFSTNLQADKNFSLTLKKEEGKDPKKANLNVYLQVNNLLNLKNVLGVYRFTGTAEDDGWLASPQAETIINNSDSGDSYQDLYTAYVNNPFNYSAPRTIRLGVKFDF